ncbi:MAG: Gfo/Idh/MocA family oxidoreductase [Ruminococcus sp.]|nr:Gfo/Idh/MocA family oxidoreductase [Ruminococcus sp.]
MEKIRWGIIGTGKIASTFARTLAAVKDAVLYAAASRTKERAQAFAEEFGFAKSYGSYAELAQDPDIDVVYIATPMASHFSDAKLCLENGLNVLCEKSVTLSAAQLQELLSLAGEKGVFFMEAMWMKCRPVYLQARRWILDGRIGRVRMVKADFSNLVPYMPEDRLYRPDCGGGALLDLAVYPLTLAADILGGEPQKIVCEMDISGGVDLSDSIILSYPGGAHASIFAGFELPLRNTALISGTEGSIILGDWFHCTGEAVLLDSSRNEVEKIQIPDQFTGYEYEVEEVHRCLREGVLESQLVPHKGTLDVMRIMDQCRAQCGLVFPEEK